MKDQILQTLEEFIKIDNTDFAYMIDGKWGSGKTYFLKNELTSHIKENCKDKKIHYSSANGVIEIKDLLNQLRWSKLPVSQKAGTILSGLATQILKMGEPLLENLMPGGSWISKIFGKVNKNVDVSKALSFLQFNSKDVVIIDDLERLHKDCDIIALIGNINSEMVEHNHAKVILVCDETELKKRLINAPNGSKKQDNPRAFKASEEDYNNSKTKVVRRTLIFGEVDEEVCESIITNVFKKNDVKEFILSSGALPFMFESLKVLDIQNLRNIKFFTEILSQVITELGVKRSLRIYKELIQTVLIDCEIYLGSEKIKRKPLTTKYQADVMSEIRNIYSVSETEQDHRQRLFGRLFKEQNDLYLNFYAIKIFVESGILDSGRLEKEADRYLAEKFLNNPTSRLIIELEDYEKLTPSRFDECFSKIKKELEDGNLNLSQFIRWMKLTDKFVSADAIEQFKSASDFEKYCVSQTKKITNIDKLHLAPSLHNLLSFLTKEGYEDFNKHIRDMYENQRAESFKVDNESRYKHLLENRNFPDTKTSFELVFEAITPHKIDEITNLYFDPDAQEFRKSFNNVMHQAYENATWNDGYHYLEKANNYLKSLQDKSRGIRGLIRIQIAEIESYPEKFKDNYDAIRKQMQQ